MPILITETGIDTGVTGNWYGGWRDLPGPNDNAKAMTYVYELLEYARACVKDGRVKQVFTFTYDFASNHWWKFDMRNQPFLDAFFAVQDQWPQVSETTTPPTLFHDWLWQGRQQTISLNTAAALQQRILSDGFTPLGNEYRATYEGIELMCQLAGRLDSAVERVYYCQIPQWDVVSFEEFTP